jgi:hypothetical protein
MGISGFKFNTQLSGLTSWFLEVASLLGHDNFNSSSWTPNITNLTGSPSITGNYTRISQRLFFTIVINGTSQTSSSKIDNLPFTAIDYDIVQIYNSTDRALIGHDYIDKDTKDVYLPDWNVTSKNIVISGNCKITGV